MTSHHELLESSRKIRRTLYLLAAFYVGVGFLLAIPAALAGDRLSAFLGFLIVSGAIGFGVMVSTVLRLGIRLSLIGESLNDVGQRLGRLEESSKERTELSVEEDPVLRCPPARTLDLAALGTGDANALAAATLDRKAYPRLATAIAGDHDETVGVADEEDPAERALGLGLDEALSNEVPPPGIAQKNLLRRWKVAVREADLASARQVYSALVDMADEETVERLRGELESLSRRTEIRLRSEFSQCVRARNFAGALEVGEHIVTLLPEHRIAFDFERIRAQLAARMNGNGAHNGGRSSLFERV